MRYLREIILLILISYSAFAKDKLPVTPTKQAYFTFAAVDLKKSQRKAILSGDIIASSDVTSFKGKILHEKPKKRIEEIDMQKFDFFIAGLHGRTCRFALKKLALYENYKQYLGFIENSSYAPKDSRVYFRISHSILPIDMVLYFILPRIKRPGIYPFMFDVGFLKDLKGEIHVSEYKKKCFFYATAKWEGPNTGFSDTLFEFFSKGMGIIAMENLFRISGGNK